MERDSAKQLTRQMTQGLGYRDSKNKTRDQLLNDDKRRKTTVTPFTTIVNIKDSSSSSSVYSAQYKQQRKKESGKRGISKIVEEDDKDSFFDSSKSELSNDDSFISEEGLKKLQQIEANLTSSLVTGKLVYQEYGLYSCPAPGILAFFSADTD